MDLELCCGTCKLCMEFIDFKRLFKRGGISRSREARTPRRAREARWESVQGTPRENYTDIFIYQERFGSFDTF